MDNQTTPAEKIERGVTLLREARDLFRSAGAPRATAKTRLALTSAEGALRHASRSDIAARRAS